MKYEKIFITGSTGVVGRPLLKKLVKEGHKVHALTRSNNNVDIDDGTKGHYLGLLNGKNNERYVLNSFYLQSHELVNILKSVTGWSGSPIYVSKSLLKLIGPIGDLVKIVSSTPPFICSESVRVLTNGHMYDGTKAKNELGFRYINVEKFIEKTVNWLIDEGRISLEKI